MNTHATPDVEEWRDIKGFEGLYQISSHGRVRSLARTIKRRNRIAQIQTRILRQYKNKFEYWNVDLKNDKIINKCRIHRLVAKTFIPNPLNLQFVDHIDRNKHNNHISNLRWCSKSQNQQNVAKTLNKSSTYKGVYYNMSRNRYHTNIRINDKQSFIGSYDNEVEAAEAYDAYAFWHFGDFACLNFPNKRFYSMIDL